MAGSVPEFSPGDILRVLNEHGVRYVLIGGLATELHGVAIERTRDVDITPSNEEGNLTRLAAALRSLRARLRAPGLPPEGLEIPLEARTFKHVTTITFVTRAGPLDIALRPDGTDGYEDLARSASGFMAWGIEVPLADLADVARSKQAAGRPKDRAHLVLIYETLAAMPPKDGDT